MGLETAVVIAIASTAATVGAVVGAVGVGLSLIGMATKNKSLMKIGKIAGIAGGALTLGSFAVSGAASAFAAEGGTLAAEGTIASTPSVASQIAESSIEATATSIANAGNPLNYAMQAGADAGSAAATTAGAVTGAEGLAPTGLTAAQQLATESRDIPATMTDAPLNAEQQSVLAQAQLRAGERGPMMGMPTSQAAQAPTIAQPMVSQPQSPATGQTGIGMMNAGAPAPTQGIPGADVGANMAPPTGQPTGGMDRGSMGPYNWEKVNANLTNMNDKPSFFASLSPGEKAMLMSGAVQGLGGMANGVFGGIGQANQAKLQRWVAEEQFKRGSYAPKVSFKGATGGGMINGN